MIAGRFIASVDEFIHNIEQSACPPAGDLLALVHCDSDDLMALTYSGVDEPFEILHLLEHIDVCPSCAERVQVIVLLRASIEERE